MKKLNFIFPLIMLFVVCCSNDSVVNNNTVTENNILRTDSLGNILGGDTTDYCNWLVLVYPNPVSDTFKVRFDMLMGGDARLYFKEQSGTERDVFNQHLNTGSYSIKLFKNSLGYNNVTVKLNMSVNGQYKCSGDVQFY